VEVVVAAVVLLTLLLSTNRALLLGMASTQRSTSRTTIESEILNDIEAIQATDSSLSADTANGCGQTGGSTYLKSKVEEINPVPIGTKWSRTLDTTEPNILIATYSFNIPGASTSSAQEKRIVELNPSFLSQCLK
jgi:type II secretory pathway pseudopilin PulG